MDEKTIIDPHGWSDIAECLQILRAAQMLQCAPINTNKHNRLSLQTPLTANLQHHNEVGTCRLLPFLH